MSGTIHELKGHQRNKTDGEEIARHFLGVPIGTHGPPEVSLTCLFHPNIQRPSATVQACQRDNQTLIPLSPFPTDVPSSGNWEQGPIVSAAPLQGP